MSDRLQPALTPDEWASRSTDDAYLYRNGISTYAGSPEYGFTVDRIPALIALANHALPADSPYKITREDVTLVRGAARSAELEHDNPGGPGYMEGALYEQFTGLNRLAAKLAALLPPEEP